MQHDLRADRCVGRFVPRIALLSRQSYGAPRGEVHEFNHDALPVAFPYKCSSVMAVSRLREKWTPDSQGLHCRFPLPPNVLHQCPAPRTSTGNAVQAVAALVAEPDYVVSSDRTLSTKSVPAWPASAVEKSDGRFRTWISGPL